METSTSHFLFTEKQKQNIFTVFSLPAILVFFLFGGLHFFQGTNPILGLIELTAAIYLSFNLIYGIKTKRLDQCSKRLLITMYLLAFIVFITGGTGSDTGNLWILLIPMISVILITNENSKKWIFTFSTILLGIVLLHYIGVLKLPYSATDMRSTLIVYVLFVILGSYAENLKTESRKSIEAKNLELMELNQSLEVRTQKAVKENIRKEQQLFEQSKMVSMGEMIGNIAHQWRQPLTTISTKATGSIVQKEIGQLSDEDFIKNMETINDNVQYLSKTIDTFRDFIKGTNKKEAVAICNILDESVNLMESSLKDNYIKLHNTIYDEEECKQFVLIPIHEFTQVIINIMNNAKDALLSNNIDNAWIRLEHIVNEEHLLITIEDNAGGIPDAIMTKIFDPYFTTKHQSQGTGLGLHMSYKIITESLEGKLWVENTENGAKFFIEIPISVE